MRLPPRVLGIISVLAVVAGVLGLVAGSNAGVTETDVINAGAALYVDETGGSVTDCVGLPGAGDVWIEVRCGDETGMHAYLFDERGHRLTPPKEPRI